MASKGASSAAPGFPVVTGKEIFVDENTSLLGSREASGLYEKPAPASGFTLIFINADCGKGVIAVDGRAALVFPVSWRLLFLPKMPSRAAGVSHAVPMDGRF